MNDGFAKLIKLYKSTTVNNKDELIKLVKSALNKKTFVNYMLTYFSKDEIMDEIDFSSFKEKLSENEYQQLHPKYHYKVLGDILSNQNFTSVDASKPTKWISITIQMIINDCIEPTFLAKLKKSGRDEILEALRATNSGNDDKLFEVSRAILRNLYGITQVRGLKGIYQSQPLAIAWWRIHLATEINKQTKIDKNIIYEYFSNNSSKYDELVLRMTSKLTIVADKNIRDGLFLYIINKNMTDNEFKEIIRKIGIESSWRAMGSLSANDNKNIIEGLVA